MQKKMLSIVLSCAMTAAFLTGGAGVAAADASAASRSAVQSSEAAADESDYGTVTIQNGDRTLTFTSMPKAVLCTNMYSTENMVMLDLQDKIVAKSIPSSNDDQPLPELADVINSIPQLENSNENAVSCGADMIIGQVSAFKADGKYSWGTYDQLDTEGIKAYTITGTIVQDETVDNIYEDLRNLGKIFKVEDKAEEVIKGMKDRISAVQEKVSSVPKDQKVKVFVMDSYNGNDIYTTSSGLESNLIELAGGINVTRGQADSRWFNTSIEAIVSSNPDLIIFNDYGSQTIEEKEEFINSNAALQDVPAVKNQNYLVIPLTSVMQDVRAAGACEPFAKAFYPDQFK